MKLTTSLFCVLLICCLAETGATFPKGFQKIIGFLERKAAELKENLDGTLEFPRELQYTLNVDGEESRDLDLVLNPFMKMPTENVGGKRKYAFYIESKTGESFACKTKLFSGKLKCEIAGITERVNETCYISPNSDKAECKTSEGFKDGFLLVLDENGNPVDRTTFTKQSNESRKVRSIFPEGGFKVVEIAFVVDEAFMLPFYKSNPDSNTAAEEEAELYVTLLANEMSAYYQSVKEVSGGQLDLLIFPSAFIFPPKGTNFYWSSCCLLESQKLLIVNGALPAFQIFANSLGNRYQFDHAMGITGMDLVAPGQRGLLGVVPELGGVCADDFNSVSLQENFGFNLGFITSHELGHSLGAEHDQSEACPSSTNIMSATLFDPTMVTRDTWTKFSSCSVNAFISHLSTYPNCINNNGFTDDQFRDSFCKGLLGAEDTSLDRQCQIRTGSSIASACATRAEASDGCYSSNPVSCKASPSEDCSTYLRFVWNGTPCGTLDGTICYKGQCVPEFNICPTGVTEDPTPTQQPCSCCEETFLGTCCQDGYDAGSVCDCCLSPGESCGCCILPRFWRQPCCQVVSSVGQACSCCS